MMNKLTPQEALVELNRLKVNGYMPTDWERLCAAVEMAKDALRKQVPRKPSTYCGMACPVCDAEVSEKMRFCSNCGQALDWSN